MEIAKRKGAGIEQVSRERAVRLTDIERSSLSLERGLWQQRCRCPLAVPQLWMGSRTVAGCRWGHKQTTGPRRSQTPCDIRDRENRKREIKALEEGAEVSSKEREERGGQGSAKVTGRWGDPARR